MYWTIQKVIAEAWMFLCGKKEISTFSILTSPENTGTVSSFVFCWWRVSLFICQTKEKGNVILESALRQGGKYRPPSKIEHRLTLGKMVVRFRYHSLNSFLLSTVLNSYITVLCIFISCISVFSFSYYKALLNLNFVAIYHNSTIHLMTDFFKSLDFFFLIKDPPQEIR